MNYHLGSDVIMGGRETDRQIDKEKQKKQKLAEKYN